MPHSTLSSKDGEIDLKRLDDMIAALERSRQYGLLIEHLHSARAYLLGAMPEEFLVSLESAKCALDAVPDGDLRRAMSDALANLLDDMLHHEVLPIRQPEHHPHRRGHKPTPDGVPSTLKNFFNVSDTSFGVFYPKKFLGASLPSFE
jgi:hypothetical protein